MQTLTALRRPFFAALIGVAAGLPFSAMAGAQDGPVRPGDRVLVRILRDSVLADTLRIDPRGYAVVPLAGDVALGGLPGGAVQDSLRASLARFVAPSAVEATVLRRIRVVGEVAKPGVFYVDRVATVRDAIAMAGGPTEVGETTRAVLERGGVARTITDWRADAAAMAPLESGDQVSVPRLPWYRRNAPYLVTAGVTILTTVILVVAR